MWELTLIYNDDKSQYLDYIYSKLLPQVKFVGGIMIKGISHDRAKVSLAIPPKHKDYFVLMLLELISEVITQDYKFAYLDDNLGELIPNEFTRSALIKALTVFDKQTDKDLIKKQLILEGELNIDRFYAFKLADLKARWSDICSLVRENLNSLQLSQGLSDLLKFLIKTSENCYDEVHITKKDKKFFLLDRKSKPINIFGKAIGEDGRTSLENLIALSPSKIVIDDLGDAKEPFYDIVSNLFEDRVYVAQSKETTHG